MLARDYNRETIKIDSIFMNEITENKTFQLA
jgi:hypothetical protein